MTPSKRIFKPEQLIGKAGYNVVVNQEENGYDLQANSGGGAASYLVYTALLTQSGTSAPVATVLENTLGGTVVWSYSGTGQYLATLNSAFTANKTAILLGSGATGMVAYWIDVDTIEVDTVDDTFTVANGRLTGDTIEIRVYEG